MRVAEEVFETLCLAVDSTVLENGEAGALPALKPSDQLPPVIVLSIEMAHDDDLGIEVFDGLWGLIVAFRANTSQTSPIP